MSWLDGARHRLRTLFFPRAYARELDEEFRLHLELDAMQQHDADHARRRFGSRAYWTEETRLMTWLGSLDTVRQDVGYALRGIARAPGFTTVVAIMLALGIGVNTAAFSLFDELYLRPPAGVRHPGTLRRIWIEHRDPGLVQSFSGQAMSHPVFRTIAQASGGSAELAARARRSELQLGRGESGSTVRGAYVSANFFDVVGVHTAVGRTWRPDEDRFGDAEPVAVVSHAFWTTHLGSDAAVPGRQVAIDGRDYTVIGILQRDFRGIDLEPLDVWLPLGALPYPIGRVPWWESHNEFPIGAVARLADAAIEPELEDRATSRVRELHRMLGRSDTALTIHAQAIMETHVPGGPDREIEIVQRLVLVSAIVLVIACANVINLLLVRAVWRRRELAVRLALGISRRRLIRLLMVEALIIAAIASAAALAAGAWTGGLLRTLIVPELALAGEPVHFRVVALTFAVALLAGIVTGLVPALRAARLDVTHALKDGGPRASFRRTRLGTGLVIVQAALSVVLLVGAGLFVRSLDNVRGLRIGFDAERLVFGAVRFAGDDGSRAPAVVARMREIAARLESAPAIEATARAMSQPMMGYGRRPFWVGPDSAGSFGPRTPRMHWVSASFFEATGMRLVRGRPFRDADGPAPTHEVVVNEAAARLLWPDRDAIGQCIRFSAPDAPCSTVVGVVDNARVFAVLEPEHFAQIYLPVEDASPQRAGTTLIVRTDPQNRTRVMSELHAALGAAFPAGRPDVVAMADALEPQYRPWRLGATLFTILGLLALAVAVVGIYGTVSYGVSQRTHEFGVRIALGARVGGVLRQVIGEGLRVVAFGVVVGVAVTLASGRLLSTLLYGVTPTDPAVIGTVSLALLVVAAGAALLPAWRASRVDPVRALRAE